MTMKAKYAVTTFAALALVAAAPLIAAAASAKDTMKPEAPTQTIEKGKP
jgi:hypothetical protein